MEEGGVGFPISSKKVIQRKTKQDGMDHCFVGIPPVSRNEKLSEFRSESEFGTKKYRNFVTNHSEAENFRRNSLRIIPKLKMFVKIRYKSFRS